MSAKKTAKKADTTKQVSTPEPETKVDSTPAVGTNPATPEVAPEVAPEVSLGDYLGQTIKATVKGEPVVGFVAEHDPNRKRVKLTGGRGRTGWFREEELKDVAPTSPHKPTTIVLTGNTQND